MRWQEAGRLVLHHFGGLQALRFVHRDKFRVLMFHDFPESCRGDLDSICGYIGRHYEPVAMDTVAAAIEARQSLPGNAVAVTIDDGYRDFLTTAYPIFKKHGIPTTVYVVVGFIDGRLWLWTDQVAFALEETPLRAITCAVEGYKMELDLSSSTARKESTFVLWEVLKKIPNQSRIGFMGGLGKLCSIEIPALPPAKYSPLSWEEIRGLEAEGVQFGSHTNTHPILSRLSCKSELDLEIRGAKQLMEDRLRHRIDHFCYPNGRDEDIGPEGFDCVKAAGFVSAVTCSYGLNTLPVDPIRIKRLPVEIGLGAGYAAEMLVGFHLKMREPQIQTLSLAE